MQYKRVTVQVETSLYGAVQRNRRNKSSHPSHLNNSFIPTSSSKFLFLWMISKIDFDPSFLNANHFNKRLSTHHYKGEVLMSCPVLRNKSIMVHIDSFFWLVFSVMEQWGRRWFLVHWRMVGWLPFKPSADNHHQR